MNILSLIGSVLICIEFVGTFIVPREQVKYIGLWPIVICLLSKYVDFKGDIAWILIWTILAVLVDIEFILEVNAKERREKK